MTELDLARLRPELLAHCYRMLGSIHDAEDAVQETLVRAWRGQASFEGRAPLRRWLYAIATRVCLTAFDQRARRALPSGGGPAWLEPFPEALLLTEPADPAGIAVARSGIRLAFVAALQHLPAKQRAALILSDVLGWPAAEVADMLGTSTAGVHSALQRARAHLRDLHIDEEDIAEPDDPTVRDLVHRYAAAFEQADPHALAALLRDDVTLDMPPRSDWYAGAAPVLDFLTTWVLKTPGTYRMTPARANGQPALDVFEADGTPHGLHVLSLRDGRISRIAAFMTM